MWCAYGAPNSRQEVRASANNALATRTTNNTFSWVGMSSSTLCGAICAIVRCARKAPRNFSAHTHQHTHAHMNSHSTQDPNTKTHNRITLNGLRAGEYVYTLRRLRIARKNIRACQYAGETNNPTIAAHIHTRI